MKFKFPLYSQIMCVFVLNIAVLALVHFTVFNNQFNLGWESLVFRTVGERVQTVAFLMFRQLESLPQDKWNDVFKEYGEFYHVKFYLFDEQGKQIAGEKVNVPTAVLSRMTGPLQLPPTKADDDILFSTRSLHFSARETFKIVEEPQFLASLDRLFSDRPRPMPPPRFFIHTKEPDSYWIGAICPVPGKRPAFFRFNTAEAPPPPPPQGIPGEPRAEAGIVRHLPENPANLNLPKAVESVPFPQLADDAFNGPPGPPVQFRTEHPHHGGPPEHVFAVLPGHGPGTLLAVTPNIWQTRLVSDFGNLLLIGLGVIALSLLVWWPFVFLMTRKIGKLTTATEKIADGDFDIRLNLRRWDELGRLGLAVNLMAGRLKSFVTGQKKFLGDIAHELCSPIARLQVAIEILERSATEQQKSSINDIREEVDQMSALINELLAFSKAGVRETELHAVSLAPILAAAAAKAGGGEISLAVPETLSCLGDEVLLERAFGNILRNAVRYAGDAGPISVSGERQGSEVLVSFIDRGPGVPSEAIEQLGQPFYRPEAARTRTTGGVGLGLSIVKTCIEACHGTFAVQNNAPTGLKIDIRLKVAGAGSNASTSSSTISGSS